jgi:hypothetical protein
MVVSQVRCRSHHHPRHNTSATATNLFHTDAIITIITIVAIDTIVTSIAIVVAAVTVAASVVCAIPVIIAIPHKMPKLI